MVSNLLVKEPSQYVRFCETKLAKLKNFQLWNQPGTVFVTFVSEQILYSMRCLIVPSCFLKKQAISLKHEFWS